MDKNIFKRFATGKYFEENRGLGYSHNSGLIKTVRTYKEGVAIELKNLNSPVYCVKNEILENAKRFYDFEAKRWCISLQFTDFITLHIYANKFH